MSAEIAHFLWEKFLKALKEEESELSGFTLDKVLFSRFHEIEKKMDMESLKRISSVNFINTVKWLYDLNDLLTDCRNFAHNKSDLQRKKKYIPFIALIRENIFFRKVRKRLNSVKDELEKLLKYPREEGVHEITFVNTVQHASSESHKKKKDASSENEIFGFDEQAKNLEKMLLEKVLHSVGFTAIGIVGMGGVGKTTLLKMVFNSQSVQEEFPKRVWICLSDIDKEEKDSELEILIAIFKEFGHVVPDVIKFLENPYKILSPERYLIVLDDVGCDGQSIEIFKNLLLGNVWSRLPKGGAVMFTTRLKEVAEYMVSKNNIVNVEFLKEEACWSIFVSNVKRACSCKPADLESNDYWPIFVQTIDQDNPNDTVELKGKSVSKDNCWPIFVDTIGEDPTEIIKNPNALMKYRYQFMGQYCHGLPLAAQALADSFHRHIHRRE
jgi:hypothetical protein